jgi:uncharacterized protein (DUF488 family)
MKLYTLGYQGLSLAEYVRILRQAQVGLVLDVRDHAWSQRPEFVKSTLRKELARVGVNYRHAPFVGNPVRIRKRARSAAECLRKYRAYIQAEEHAIQTLQQMIAESVISGHPVCLTCYERDPSSCHREILVDLLTPLNKGLEVVHLPPVDNRRVLHEFARNDSLTKTAFLQPGLLPLWSKRVN